MNKPFIWTGRNDKEDYDNQGSNLGVRIHHKMQTWTHGPLEKGQASEQRPLVLLGFVSDEGVRRNQGRIGAKEGPLAFRKALANQAWHGTRALYDGGDVVCEGQNLEFAQQRLGERVYDVLEKGGVPFVIGGGHEVAFGTGQGILKALQSSIIPKGQGTMAKGRLGIINFDAHFDLRKPNPVSSSGTPFFQLLNKAQDGGLDVGYTCLGISEYVNTKALFKTAKEHTVSYLLDAQCQYGGQERWQNFLKDFMSQCDTLYLTLDLDVLPSYSAPGVSAPASLGVPAFILEQMIELILKTTRRAKGPKLLGMDMAELNPVYDKDNRTARLAARLAMKVFEITPQG